MRYTIVVVVAGVDVAVVAGVAVAGHARAAVAAASWLKCTRL